MYVQMFRKIPMQIRVKTEMEEVRESLSDRFVQAAMDAGMSSPNLIRERTLVEWGIRYGEPAEIAEQVLEELKAAYDPDRLHKLKERAKRLVEGEEPVELLADTSPDEVLRALDDPRLAQAICRFGANEAGQKCVASAGQSVYPTTRCQFAGLLSFIWAISN